MEEAKEKAGDDEQRICRRKNGKCKNVSGDNILQYCEKHYNNYLDLTKKIEEDYEEPPPDEQRCTQTSGTGKYRYRCKNFRMGLGAAADNHNVPKTKHCEKHYNCGVKSSQKHLKKKRSENGEGAANSKRRRKVREEDDVTKIQPATSADTITGDGTTATIRRKRENVERMEGTGELESLTRTWEPVVKSKSTFVHYKSKCYELSLELEKKKIECTKLQGQLAEVVQTRKTAATEETERTPAGANQCWRKMFPDLESRVLRMENGNSTIAQCVESRISKLESLAPRGGKENYILRFIDLPDSVKVESEAQGLENHVTQSGEKQIDETSCGGKEYPNVHELKTKEEVLNMYENVEEGKVGGCSEEGPSQNHLDMSKKPFANLVSHDDSCESLGESEDSGSSGDTETSLGSLMDMLAMKYRNMKWKFEADMLSSLEEDPELNLKAVCALYRQHITEAEKSTKGLFHYNDALRATTLAKFLMDGACKGDLKKSVKELERFDLEGVEDCKRLATSYSKQLFSIYQNRRDPFFLSTTASHGDQTAKG